MADSSSTKSIKTKQIKVGTNFVLINYFRHSLLSPTPLMVGGKDSGLSHGQGQVVNHLRPRAQSEALF